jgi:hypothetical protein
MITLLQSLQGESAGESLPKTQQQTAATCSKTSLNKL